MIMVDRTGYEEIRSWLIQRCGITYPEHKGDLLRQRLARVTSSFSITNLNDLADRLIRDGNYEVQLAVMHAASTNHTYFFREPEILDRFQELILPTMNTSSTIRIWSAASSTGDEAFTLAMIIAERFGLDQLQRFEILGTDISEPVIEHAERGLYNIRHFNRMPPDILEKYFKRVDSEHYQLKDVILKSVTFRRMNLISTPYPFQNQFDIIFCRNVFYYFDKTTQEAVLAALHNAISANGWLVTSVTESLRNLRTPWAQIETGIFKRQR